MAGKYGCTGTNKNGDPCNSRPVKGTTLCAAHDGTLASVSKQGALARIAKAHARREQAQNKLAMASLSLDERLRIAVAEEGDALIAQLIKLAKDGDRQAIALVFDRVEGRSVQRVQTEAVTDTSDLASLSMEELRKLAGPLRVLPGGKAADGLDTGIRPASAPQ